MTDTPPQFNPETAPPSLTIDWDAYLPLFEDDSISDEDKRELIDALWSIVVSFVDLGFGVHPAQQVCGQDTSLAELPNCDVLESSSTPIRSASEDMGSEAAPKPEKGSPPWE